MPFHVRDPNVTIFSYNPPLPRGFQRHSNRLCEATVQANYNSEHCSKNIPGSQEITADGQLHISGHRYLTVASRLPAGFTWDTF